MTAKLSQNAAMRRRADERDAAMGDDPVNARPVSDGSRQNMPTHSGRSGFTAIASDRPACPERDNAQSLAQFVGALRADELFLNVQPVVDAVSRQPVFHEALLRMRSPTDGQPISCSQAILNAERAGVMRLIDCRTLDLAVDTLRTYPAATIAVNLSAATVADPGWTAQFQGLAINAPDLISRMIIELTETARYADLDTAISFVDMLRDAGARVAIDDFGAGYNSLLQIKHFGVDIAKIDGAFTPTVGASDQDFVFVRRLMELAQDLGIETVAEHVSDAATADRLSQLGITYLQGFAFGYPESAASLLGPPADQSRATRI